MNKLITGVNDLQTVNPELAGEWDYEKNGELSPKTIHANSGKSVWWIGKCGHNWCSKVYKRNEGTGCPYCTGQRVLTGFNDLKTAYPQIADEWNYDKNGNLNPCDVTAHSRKRYGGYAVRDMSG